MRETSELLNRVLILEECGKEERKTFARHLSYYVTKKNEILFNQDDPGTALFVVAKGIVGSRMRMPDGGWREVARFSAGMSFGEMAMIEAAPRSSTCYALTDVELLVINASQFHDFIDRYPAIGIKIVKAMTRNVISWLYDANNFLNTMVMWGEKARLRAITDEVSGLYNRRFFEESLELHISKSRVKKLEFCLLMFDLDNFHEVNDRLGVTAGDGLLKSASLILKKVFRGRNTLARLGGDEFAALLEGVSAEEGAALADSFRRTLDATEFQTAPSSPARVTVSIGIAEYPADGETAVHLKAAADKALFQAKEAGKNRIVRSESEVAT